MGREVLILRESEIRSLLDAPTCIEAVENAFTSHVRSSTSPTSGWRTLISGDGGRGQASVS